MVGSEDGRLAAALILRLLVTWCEQCPPAVTALLATPAPSDEDLVARARRGERDAEEALYRRHAPYVGRFVAHLLGSATDAEDVLQETFCLALDRLADLREPAAFRGWVAQIAINRVRRHFRARRLLRFFGLGSQAAGLEGLIAQDVSGETRAELALLDAALDRISSDERIPWILHHVEGVQLDEAARLLGCSLATVKRRIGAAQAAVDRHRGSRDE